MTKLEHALALAAKGFKVFPIAPNAKAPPLLTGWPKRASVDADEVRDFWVAVPNANIGIHCEDLVVIDVDSRKGGNESIELLEMMYELPDTLHTLTPSGGRHIFYRLPENHKGVPNSVGTLGRGLDIRSNGGYVVAPGSHTDAGNYEFELDSVTCAIAPAWLIDRLGQAPVARAEPAAPVPPAPESSVERAAAWLQTAERSVKGQGGDQAAYRVACALRDFGVSEAQAGALMRSAAWDNGCGWRSGWLEAKPIRSAYKYAQNEPGSRITLPDDFPTVPTEAGINPGNAQYIEQKSPVARRLSQFANSEYKGPGYVVKGLLQRRSYAELFGAPGEGKTFIALDLAYHTAAGLAWMDRKIHPGPVLYLAYEGTGGLVKRAQALRQHYGNKDVPLYVAGAAFNLRELAGRKALGQVIAELPTKPIFIVIDTFARALMGGDENSAQDVGAFNTAIAALIENTGACVLIVHHSGKNKSAGARGSSALLGAIDTELEIENGQVTARKQRDIELTPPIGFKLVPLVVGIDEDGDEVTSCVVEPAAITSAIPVGRLTGNAKRGFQALCSLAPDNKPVAPDDWQEACTEFLGSRTRQGFYDLKKALLHKKCIVQDTQGFITRRLE